MLTTEEKAERKRQATARYRAKNLEKIRAYARGRMRRLREEDPDKIRKSKKLSYQKNRKAVSEGGRERRGSQILDCLRCGEQLEPGPRSVRRICKSCRDNGWCTRCTKEKSVSKGHCLQCVADSKAATSKRYQDTPINQICKCGVKFLRKNHYTQCDKCRSDYHQEQWQIRKQSGVYDAYHSENHKHIQNRQRQYHHLHRSRNEKTLLGIFGVGGKYLCACGFKSEFKNPFSLHHLDTTKKTITFNQALRRGNFDVALLRSEEVELICENCHRLKHYQGVNNGTQGHVSVLWGLGVFKGCFSCRRPHPLGVYDFHHVDPSSKLFNISSKGQFSAVISEISKCALLCSICHRLVHARLVQCPLSLGSLYPTLFLPA